ncbi:MAG: hypothetical protein R8M38_06960 [Mariprofundaceae bacterium]
MQNIDVWLTLFLSMGMFQVSWLSTMLHRRGIPAKRIRQSLPPLLTIWVLAWPIYQSPASLWIGLLLIGGLLLLTFLRASHTLCDLSASWSHPSLGLQPLLVLFVTLIIATATFQTSASAGFASALCTFLVPSIVTLVDDWSRRISWLHISQLVNRQQSTLGHIVMFAMTTWITSWAIAVYHQNTIHQELSEAWPVAIAATVVRAFIPSLWAMPAIALVIGILLWL